MLQKVGSAKYFLSYQMIVVDGFRRSLIRRYESPRTAASTPVFINMVFRRLKCESITLRMVEVAAAPRLNERTNYDALGSRQYRRCFLPGLCQSRGHVSRGTTAKEMQPVTRLGRGRDARVGIAHTVIEKTKLPAMPCITPCVSMKCQSLVLKATPSIVKTQRMQPIPIIGLYWLHDTS